MAQQKDPVDRIKEQWQKERPELATDAMETLGRLKRCSVLYQPFIDETFEKFELSSWEFDVLATLRRTGKPYVLSPTQLFATLMVTSGTMTHRLKSLEKKQLIQRVDDVSDARSKGVKLTAQGLECIEEALTAHVDTMESLLIGLSENEQKVLNRSLKKLLAVFEGLHEKRETAHAKLSSKMHTL